MSAARREVDVRDLFAAEKKGHIVYTWDFHFGKRSDNGRKQRKENLSAPGRTAPTNCASSRSSAPARRRTSGGYVASGAAIGEKPQGNLSTWRPSGNALHG